MWFIRVLFRSGRSAYDLLYPVCLVFECPVYSKVSYRRTRSAFEITAAAVGMGGVQFPDELANDVIHIGAGASAGNELTIMLTQVLPIDSVHRRIIKEIAFNPPGIGEYLCPFFSRYHTHLHIVQRNGFVKLFP